MNLHIKGTHMTRKISTISISEKGHVFVRFKPHVPFHSEHLLFFPGEIEHYNRETIFNEPENTILDEDLPLVRDRLSPIKKLSPLRLFQFFVRLFTGGFDRSDS